MRLNGAGPGYVEVSLPSGGAVRHYSDGCVAQAEGRLYGSFATWYRVKKLTENLVAVRRERVTGSPVFTAAQSRWAACMKAHRQPSRRPTTRAPTFVVRVRRGRRNAGGR